ncbi:MAG: YerC/YecD family TrpR-related protein [bacterium]
MNNTNNWDNQNTKELLEAILTLKNTSEAKKFFRDLLTKTELIEFGNRWKAVKMLVDGETYIKIEKETGLSSTTVARISKWLKHGMGGYKIMTERMNKKR